MRSRYITLEHFYDHGRLLPLTPYIYNYMHLQIPR